VPLALRDRFASAVSQLVIDQPGVGEALRLNGLTAVYNNRAWASAAVDYLETAKYVDPKRIGMMGWVYGWYYAPRRLPTSLASRSAPYGRQS